MNKTQALARIKRGLGFMTGTSRDSAIIDAMQEAQRELETGKTLPKFLLQEDQPLAVLAGASSAPLPTGFIRQFDDERLHFLPVDSDLTQFLNRKLYIDGVLAYRRNDAGVLIAREAAPQIYVIRKSTIDFLSPMDRDYNFLWSYYKHDVTLDTVDENGWLTNAPEWLIGEAGKRIAADMRDAVAVTLFKEMALVGQSSYLREIVANEEADGPWQMGADN
jgi:hypothetical protein